MEVVPLQPDRRHYLRKAQYNNSYSYNAEDYNPNLEVQYLRARYNDVERGNFLTEDPYLGSPTDPLRLNRYNCAE